MFLNESNNGTASGDTTIFNPFEALFGGGIVVVIVVVAVKEMTLVLVSLTMVHLEMTLQALL